LEKIMPFLLAINRGEFLLQGLRNRDLQRLLFTTGAVSEKQRHQRSAQVSRQLRMLRAHGLVQKVPKTHRYQVTEAARTILAALFAACNAKLSQLTALPVAA
jgi:DNA-binding HxlR family transcriptional regulator